MFSHKPFRAASVTMALLTALALSVALGQAPERPGQGMRVEPGVGSWTSALPISWIFYELLRELGYDVAEPTMFPSNPVAYLSIAQGDIDYWSSGSFPLHDAHLPDQWEERGAKLEPFCAGCSIQGYLVDIPSIERYGITSLDDFRRDEVREAFDATGDGRADLVGCPVGWGCHEVIEATLDAFGLRDDIHHITAEYTAGFADALTRFEAGEPTLVYTWAPSAWILELVPGEDVRWINTPDILESEEEIAEGMDGAATDPLRMGFIPGDMTVAANQEFLAANPAAEELFDQVTLPLRWISEADARIAEENLSDAEIRALAVEWIEGNRDLVDEWLQAAREAAP